MRFIEDIEILEWCREHGVPDNVESAVTPVVMRRTFGQCANPEGQEAEVAAATLDALGPWDECLLWVTQWGIWPSSEDWPAYYGERAVHGERRSLETTPAHLAETVDQAALARFLQLVLENAWDARVIPSRDGRFADRIAFVSHDEVVTVIAF